MNLYVNLDTLQLIEGPGFRNPITALRFKRGDAARLEVTFLHGGTSPASIGNPDTLELHFGIKPRNRYDAGYLVHSADWTLPATDATTPVYQCSPSFNTLELDAEFGIGSSAGTELAEITLMGEITWREGAGEPTSTRTFLVVVENDVNRGTEGVPLSAEPAYPAPGNIITISTLGTHAVRFDVAQSLSDAQKAQARANIGATSGVQLSDTNTWTGSNTFASGLTVAADMFINYGSPAAFDLYYRNPATGAVAALPIGGEGQVLSVVSGVLAWVTPVPTSEWTMLGRMTSDGMSNTFSPYPWVPPSFNGDTEEVVFRVTSNSVTPQAFYMDFGLMAGWLETNIVSQSFANAPTVYVSNYMGAYVWGIMDPMYMIRVNDTFQFSVRVPANMLPYGMFDYMDPFSGPMSYFASGSDFTVEYKIQPRSA